MKDFVVKGVSLALLVSLAFFSVVVAQDDGKPNAVIEETAVDLGQIYEQEKYTHEYTIKNTGNAKLYVTKVKPG